MSDNQINTIIESITNSITSSMNQNLTNYRVNLNDDEEIVVEEMSFEINGNQNDIDSDNSNE
jgi:hypothetical protein